MEQGRDNAVGAASRQFAVHVAADQVERFSEMCRAIGIGFELGGRVRIRDWRTRTSVRDGRSVIFRRREDLETVLAYEQYLQKYQLLAG